MPLNRRAFLNACSAAGIASPLLPGILYTLAVQAQETVPPTPASAPPRPIRSEVAGTGTIRPTYPYDNHVLYHPTRS